MIDQPKNISEVIRAGTRRLSAPAENRTPAIVIRSFVLAFFALTMVVQSACENKTWRYNRHHYYNAWKPESLSDDQLTELDNAMKTGEEEPVAEEEEQTDIDLTLEKRARDQKKNRSKLLKSKSQRILFRMIERGSTFTLPFVEYATGADALDDRAQRVLDILASVLTIYPEIELKFIGNTDSEEAKGSEQILAAKRAENIYKYLTGKKMIDANRLIAVGVGASRPVMPNFSIRGRIKNRRIDVEIIKGPD